MRSKFASNAIAKKPARKTPSPTQLFNLTGLANTSKTIAEQAAMIRKVKVSSRTAKQKKLLRILNAARKEEKERKKRTGPIMKMKTGATNFVLEGSPSAGSVKSASPIRSGSGSAKKVKSPSSGSGSGSGSGKTKAVYAAAAARARAAAAASRAGGYTRPSAKKTAATRVARSPASPPKGVTKRNATLTRLIENMQKQKGATSEVRRMAAADTTTATIRNARGGKGYYSMM
jgi:hypothetical protein